MGAERASGASTHVAQPIAAISSGPRHLRSRADSPLDRLECPPIWPDKMQAIVESTWVACENPHKRTRQKLVACTRCAVSRLDMPVRGTLPQPYFPP